MSNESQAKTLKEVLELEKYLVSAEKKLLTKKNESFSAAPQPPICETINRTYPKIVPQVKFNKALAIIPTLFFWPWIAIYYFAIYRKEKEADIERIRNSEEYRNECAQLDAEYDTRQIEANKQYELQKKQFDTVTMPNYQKNLDAWNKKHEQEIDVIKNDISISKSKLASIYDETKVVPMQYRNIEALEYIYNMVSTSDYDVTYAINNYDTHRQRMLDTERMHIEEARLQEQQLANNLADEQSQLIYEQNMIAEKARKEAKFASTVGMIQHHNTNKTLKGMKKKF